MLVDALLRHRLDVPRAQVLVHALLQPHALKKRNASHAERPLQLMDPPPRRYFQASVALVAAAAVAVAAAAVAAAVAVDLVDPAAPGDGMGFVENSPVVFREHRSPARRTASPFRWAFAAAGRILHADKEMIFVDAFVEVVLKLQKREEEEAVALDSGLSGISVS